MDKDTSNKRLHKQEPVFTKPITDYTMFKQSMLLRLMAMARTIEMTHVEQNDCGTQESLGLRSLILPTVTYELIRIKKQDAQEIYIYVCTADEETVSRNCCVYANGDVLVWGAWMVELLEALPSTYEKVRTKYYDLIIKRRTEENLLPEMTEPWTAKEIAEFNRNFNNSMFVSKEVLDEHYKNFEYVIY